MPSDELSFFYPALSADQSELDQMRYALANRAPPKPADYERTKEIPTPENIAYGNYLAAQDALKRQSQVKATTPQGQFMERVIAPFVEPLMSMGTGMVSMPLAAGESLAKTGVTKGLELANIITPEQRAELLRKTPSIEQQIAARTYEPRSELGKENLLSAMQMFEASKLPHAWPVAGGRAPTRRMLTPDDVRAMGGQAAKLKQEVRDIPIDFPNAREGIVKLDQFGEPTVGAKLGVVANKAESVGQALDLPGITDQPPTGAIKLPGGQLMVPKPFGETAPPPGDLPTGKMYTTQSSISPTGNVYFKPQAVDLYDMYKDTFFSISGRNDAERALESQMRMAFDDFKRKQLESLFPDAAADDAMQAFNLLYPREKRVEMLYDWLGKFVETPEVQSMAQALGRQLPSTAEFSNRIDAANQWIAGPFTQYVQKFAGTEKDPLLQLAEQGLTFKSATDLIYDVDRYLGNYPRVAESIYAARSKLGKDPEGSYKQVIAEKETELEILQDDYRTLNAERRALGEQILAENPNRDPASDPRYAATTNPLISKEKEITRIALELDNLKLADRFELISDAIMLPKSAKDVKQALSYAQKKFFPGIEKIPESETVYDIRQGALEESGLEDAGRNFVRDIVQGVIPIDKIKDMPLAKFIQQAAEARVKEERNAKLAEIKYINDLQNKLVDDLNNLPTASRFGNITAVTVDSSYSKPEIARILSADTEVLDHCVASGGPGGKRRHFLTGNSRSHEPVMNPITGSYQTKFDESQLPRYIRSVEEGASEIVSIRDNATGYPVATIELIRQSSQRASTEDIVTVLEKYIDQDGIKRFLDRANSSGVSEALTRLQNDLGPNERAKFDQIYNEIEKLPFGDVFYMGYANGYQNGKIDKNYLKGIAEYLNANSNKIAAISSELRESGVYDKFDLGQTRSDLARDFSTTPAILNEAFRGMPRFVTRDEVNKIIQDLKMKQALEADPNDPILQGMVRVLKALEDAEGDNVVKGRVIANDLRLRPHLYGVDSYDSSTIQAIADMLIEYDTYRAPALLEQINQEIGRRKIIQEGGTPQEMAAKLVINRLINRYSPNDSVRMSSLIDNVKTRPAMYDLDIISEDVRAQLAEKLSAFSQTSMRLSALQNRLLEQSDVQLPAVVAPQQPAQALTPNNLVGTGTLDIMRRNYDPNDPLIVLYETNNTAVASAYQRALDSIIEDATDPGEAIDKLREYARNILDDEDYAEHYFDLTTANQRDLTARYLNSHAYVIDEYMGPLPAEQAPAQVPALANFQPTQPNAALLTQLAANQELNAYRDIMGYVADEIRTNQLQLNDVPANLRNTADMLLSESLAARNWWQNAFNFENDEQRRNVANVVREHADMIENNLQQQQALQVAPAQTATEAYDRYFEENQGFNTPETFQVLVDLADRAENRPDTLPGVQPEVLGTVGMNDLSTSLATTLYSRAMEMDPLQYRNILATSITDIAARTGNYIQPVPMLRLQLFGDSRTLYDNLLTETGGADTLQEARNKLAQILDAVDRLDIFLDNYPELIAKRDELQAEGLDTIDSKVEVLSPIKDALDLQLRAIAELIIEENPPQDIFARGGFVQNPTMAQMRAEMMLRNHNA